SIEILPGPTDNVKFNSINDLLDDIKINGYYGGFRLIKATIKQFFDFIRESGTSIPDKKFTIRYTSNIPRQVGLAGSSAIITSTMKALAQFYGISIDLPDMANYVMWAETKELGISAGLQDRVVQVYDQPVFMDFNRQCMEEKGCGIYNPVPVSLLPPLYLAYQSTLTHKDIVHNDVRRRFECGDSEVIDVMESIAANAQEGYNALKARDIQKFNACINKNFDLRAKIYPISPMNLDMIRVARKAGATSKFPGSGGAVIGTYEDEAMFSRLVDAFKQLNATVIKIRS
nr:GHMP kinase [Candidatus Sigynarchaeota archaeon]